MNKTYQNLLKPALNLVTVGFFTIIITFITVNPFYLILLWLIIAHFFKIENKYVFFLNALGFVGMGIFLINEKLHIAERIADVTYMLLLIGFCHSLFDQCKLITNKQIIRFRKKYNDLL